MDTVCVPHTSINFILSPTSSRILSSTPLQISGSLSLSNKFKIKPLLEQLYRFQTFFPIQSSNSKPGMNNNKITYLRLFVYNVQTDFVLDSPNFYPGHIVFNRRDFHGNS